MRNYNERPIFHLIFRGVISLSKNPAKVDLENMRIERNYKRADLRRLSTESYVRQKEENRPSLLTHWVWYRKEESGEWVEYGGKVRCFFSKLKQSVTHDGIGWDEKIMDDSAP